MKLRGESQRGDLFGRDIALIKAGVAGSVYKQRRDERYSIELRNGKRVKRGREEATTRDSFENKAITRRTDGAHPSRFTLGKSTKRHTPP